MGSPLGPLMANAFMCSVEEKLARENKLPSFYKRYVDDTLAPLRDLSDATDLLACHNEAHSSIQFTMEIATNDRLPFIGMEIIKIDGSLETCVYRKKTNKGLLQEGGGVSRVNIGRLIATSVTSRHTSMFFQNGGQFSCSLFLQKMTIFRRSGKLFCRARMTKHLKNRKE